METLQEKRKVFHWLILLTILAFTVGGTLLTAIAQTYEVCDLKDGYPIKRIVAQGACGGLTGDSSYSLNPLEATNYVKVLDLPMNPRDIALGDANHNNKMEIYRDIFLSPSNWFVRVFEVDGQLNWTFTDLAVSGLVWDLGDVDGNGKMDLVTQDVDFQSGLHHLKVWESPDPYSYPTVLKYDIVMPARRDAEYRASIVDTDNDGIGEIVMSANGSSGSDIRIYKIENGSTVLKWLYPTGYEYTLTKAVADFDAVN